MASRKHQRNGSAISVHFVKQDLDAHTAAGTTAAPPAAQWPPGDLEDDPYGPRLFELCRSCGLGQGFKALVSCHSITLSAGHRSPSQVLMRMATPGSRSRCGRTPVGHAAPPSFGAAFWLGCHTQPTCPFGLWRPRADVPQEQRPVAPPRENGLWIEGDKLDFMTLTVWGGQGLQVTLLTSADTVGGAQGRRLQFFFSLF